MKEYPKGEKKTGGKVKGKKKKVKGEKKK